MARNIQPYLTNQYPDIKVLFVEEEGFSREKLLRILKRRFSTIYLAKDSTTAFQVLQQQFPDLIIADIKLDEGRQVEMIQRIREMNDKVQVILTSVYNGSDDPSFKIMTQSANHIILKPLDLDKLFQAIQSSVYQIRLEKEVKQNVVSIDQIKSNINRLKFIELLTNELKQANQCNQPLSVIKMEIDFFNKIWDCFGKTEAEKVLNTIITIVQQRIREKDIFEHWKTEEFLLLLPDTNQQDATSMAESLSYLIESFEFESVGRVTCSFGITGYQSSKSYKELLNEVCLALDASKTHGPNRITLFKKDQ